MFEACKVVQTFFNLAARYVNMPELTQPAPEHVSAHARCVLCQMFATRYSRPLSPQSEDAHLPSRDSQDTSGRWRHSMSGVQCDAKFRGALPLTSIAHLQTCFPGKSCYEAAFVLEILLLLLLRPDPLYAWSTCTSKPLEARPAIEPSRPRNLLCAPAKQRSQQA